MHWDLAEQEHSFDLILIFKTKIFGEYHEEIIAQHNETARTGVSESVRGAMALPQTQNFNVGATNFEATFFKRCEGCHFWSFATNLVVSACPGRHLVGNFFLVFYGLFRQLAIFQN